MNKVVPVPLERMAAREQAMAQVCTHEWNRGQDAGRSFAEGARLLKAEHPDKAELIDAYGAPMNALLFAEPRGRAWRIVDADMIESLARFAIGSGKQRFGRTTVGAGRTTNGSPGLESGARAWVPR